MHSSSKDVEHQNEVIISNLSNVEIRSKRVSSNGKFQKLWSEADEVTLLNGYYEYHLKGRGKNDAGGFFEFIKHRLIRSSVTAHQISDKVRRLKNKCMLMISKLGEEDNLQVTDPHIQKLLVLSKRIWGTNTEDESNGITSNTKFSSPPFKSNILVSEDNNVLTVDTNFSSPLLTQTNPKCDFPLQTDNDNHVISMDTNLPSPPVSPKPKYSSSDDISKEFLSFVLNEGVYIYSLDAAKVNHLKKKFGEMELAKLKVDYRESRLILKMAKLKHDYYSTVYDQIFIGDES